MPPSRGGSGCRRRRSWFDRHTVLHGAPSTPTSVPAVSSLDRRPGWAALRRDTDRGGEELGAQAHGGDGARARALRVAPHARISDVEWMGEVLEALGTKVEWTERAIPRGPQRRRPRSRGALRAGREDAGFDRAARPAAGAMRRGPHRDAGGDDFGSRPINMHLAGLEALGATFELRHGTILGAARTGWSEHGSCWSTRASGRPRTCCSQPRWPAGRPSSTTRRGSPRSPTSRRS